MRKRWIAAFLCCSILFFPVASISGNLALIEKRLIELNKINKEAVEQVGQLPQYGSVDLEAKVLPEDITEESKSGTTRTRFVLGKKTILALDKPSPYTVQIAASRSKESCFRVANMLRRAGYPAFTGAVRLKERGVWYRIFIGSYSKRQDAERAKSTLEDDEINDVFVRSLPYAIQVGENGTYDVVKPLQHRLFALKYMPYTSKVRNAETKEGRMRLLVGAFAKKENASTLIAELRHAGLDARIANR